MTTTKISVTYDTSLPSTTLRAYRVDITGAEPGESETDRLVSVPPVYNGRAFCKGVFSSRLAALQALGSYIKAPFAVVEVTEGGQSTIHVERADARGGPTQFGSRQVLYRRATSGGTYVSAVA